MRTVTVRDISGQGLSGVGILTALYRDQHMILAAPSETRSLWPPGHLAPTDRVSS